jgi:hypothetical protein
VAVHRGGTEERLGAGDQRERDDGGQQADVPSGRVTGMSAAPLDDAHT